LTVHKDESSVTKRAGHSLTALPSCHNKFLIFGGWDGSRDALGAEIGALGNLVLLHVGENDCSMTAVDIPNADKVYGRDCHSADLIEDGYLVLFGGCDTDFNYLDHTNLANIRMSQ